MLSHGSRHWSQVRNGVSVLISTCDRELGLFLEVQQGSQTSLSVATGNSEFHSNHCHEISPYVELWGTQCPFNLEQGPRGPSPVSTGETRQHFQCEWNIGIPLQSKNENQPSSRDDLGYTELFPVSAVTSGFL